MKKLLFVFICIICLSLTASASLVGYWTFDGNTNDSSGYGLHGTLIADAAISADAKAGSGCLYVDGSGTTAYAEILGQSNFTIPSHLPAGSEDRTVAFFMKAEPDSNSNSTMFSYGNAPSSGGTRFDVLLNSSNQLRVEMSGDPSTGYNYFEDYSGDWVHVAVTYTAGLIEVFIDGASIGTKTDVTPYINTGSETGAKPFVLTFGSSFNEATRPYRGCIDDVRIYDAVLSPAEIAGIALGNEPSVVSPSPEDNSEGIVPGVTMSWQSVNAQGATFDINIGTTTSCSELVDGISTAASMSYTPESGLLSPGSTYYWRVDTWQGGIEYSGEVWSFTTGGKASNPKPEDGLIYVSPVRNLSWTVDMTGLFSKVYFGPAGNLSLVGTYDQAEVSLAECAQSLGLTILPPNAQYQWRVDIVDAGDNTISTGDTWSFTTEDYDWTWPVVVEDFDAYADTSELLTQWSVTSGDAVTLDSPARTAVFTYDNQSAPFTSEITRTFAEAQDWTDYGAAQISLKIIGNSGNSTEQVYLKVSDATTTATIDLPNIDTTNDRQWQIVNLSLDEFSSRGVDLTQITELVLGCGIGNPGGTGTLYVNDIVCYQYRCLPEFRPLGDITGDCKVDILDVEKIAADWLIEDYSVTASAPTVGLVASYQFEDSSTTVSDSSGNGYDATVDPQGVTDYWNTNGKQANCLQISGDLSLSLPVSVFNSVSDTLTIAFWLTAQTGQFPEPVNTVNVGAGPVLLVFDAQNPVYIQHGANVWGHAKWQMASAGEYEDIWNHYAIVKDASAGTMKIYHNGILVSQTTQDNIPMEGSAAGQTTIALRSAVDLPVKIDDLQIYNTPLDPEAIAFLATGPGATVIQPIHPVLTDVDSVMDGVINLSDFATLAADWMTAP